MSFFRLNYKRILVIATRQIGDVLVTTPLIHAIRMRWPHAQIDVLGYVNTVGMLEGNSDINNVIESSEHPGLAEYWALLARLFRSYEIAFITQGSDRAHIYGFLFAKTRVGVVSSVGLHSWWKRLLSKHSVKIDYHNQHAVTEKMRLLEPFVEGDLFSNGVSVIPPVEKDLPDNVLKALATIQRPLIVFHATPMWRYKRWKVVAWQQLADALDTKGFSIVLTGSSAIQDIELNKEITAGRKHVLDLTGQLSLPQVCTLMGMAQLFVGVDTSVTHLAAAKGLKTVTIFGPTPPTNFGPWPKATNCEQPFQRVAPIQVSRNVTIIQGEKPCVPCRKSGCEDHFDSRSDCLEELKVERVIKCCEELLG